MTETELILEGGGKESLFPPFSARECVQSLTPLFHGTLRRTLEGTLVWVGSQGPQKFQSLIRGKDKAPPAFEGLWGGMSLKVGCLQSLTKSVPAGVSSFYLERDPVACYLYDSSGKKWPLEEPKGKEVIIPSDFPGGFLTYRPWLMMKVKNYHLETDEWGASVEWQLELEEI